VLLLSRVLEHNTSTRTTGVACLYWDTNSEAGEEGESELGSEGRFSMLLDYIGHVYSHDCEVI
jgi:hypothetical protein